MSTNPMHGWWIDGEYVPCECVRCQLDREEIEEERWLSENLAEAEEDE